MITIHRGLYQYGSSLNDAMTVDIQITGLLFVSSKTDLFKDYKNKPDIFLYNNGTIVCKDNTYVIVEKLNIKVCVFDVEGIGNVLKSYINALSIDSNSVIESNLNNYYGDYSLILDEKHLMIPNDQREEFIHCWKFLLLKNETKDQKHLKSEFGLCESDNIFCKVFFNRKISIDLHYKKSLISDTIFNRIQNVISKIKFKDIIYKEVNKVKLPLKTLGISVRTWKSKHEKNVNRKYKKKDYFKALDKILSKTKISNVFLSYDNPDVELDYIKYLKGKGIDKKNIVIYKNSSIQPMQEAIINMLILSSCKYYLCNRISTFSELVFWFGKCDMKVHTIY